MNFISRISQLHRSIPGSFSSFHSSLPFPLISVLENSCSNPTQQSILPIHHSSESLHGGSRMLNTAGGFSRPMFFSSGTLDVLRFSSNLSVKVCSFNLQYTLPFLMSSRSLIHSETPDSPTTSIVDTEVPKPDELYQPKEVARPMDFVRGVVETPQFNNLYKGTYPDIVNINIKRNNCFVTVTDNNGFTKAKLSKGMLKLGKARTPKYGAGELVAEHLGQKCRKLGITAVVVKVKGFIHFKRKKQAILAWKEGFTGSKGDLMNPIVCVEDRTRRQHNGCRKRKRWRG